MACSLLNYIDELEPSNIDTMEKHNETDEVFVLLEGECILFFGVEDTYGNIIEIKAQPMHPKKLYNVKQGVYHTHVLSKTAKVLIIENYDTGDSNSSKLPLNAIQKASIKKMTNEIMEVQNEIQLRKRQWHI